MSSKTTSRPNLRVVTKTEAKARRVYVVGLDHDEFNANLVSLMNAGYIIANTNLHDLTDEVDLRAHLTGLLVADDLMLPSTWWTSATAHQLVHVAGWLGLPFVESDGRKIPSSSLKAGR